jgi:hypothetical protein
MRNLRALGLALLMTVMVGTGCSRGKTNTPVTGSTQTSVTIRPSAVTLAQGETVSFSVDVTGSFTSVLWVVLEGAEGGSVSQDGFYTAPAREGLFHVVAVVIDQNHTAISATADVTVSDRTFVGSMDAGSSDRPKDGSGEIPRDAGSRDMGLQDSASRDAALQDAGARDVGPQDMAPKDAGPQDAGATSTPHVSRDPNGWTVVIASSDSRIIHVSSSVGDDKNNGSEATPLKTIAAGMRQMRRGYPDWLLLKTGDSWRESFATVAGRSADEPALISSYGPGLRPRITPVGDAGIAHNGPSSHLYVMGLDFYDPAKDPNSDSFKDGVESPSAVSWIDGGDDLLVEDCSFRFLSGGFTVQATNLPAQDKIQIRRNFISDLYTQEGHTQGSAFKKVSNVLIEENIFDHNGWIVDPKVTRNEFNAPNALNHDIDLEGPFNHVVIRGNVFMRSSSMAVKFANYDSVASLSTDVVVENNFFFEGEIGMAAFCDAPDMKTTEPTFSGFTIQNNVLLQINRDNPMKRAGGWGLLLRSVGNSTVKGNIFSDFSFTENTYAIELSAERDSDNNSGVIIDSNIAYRIPEAALRVIPRAIWSKNKVINNVIDDDGLGAAMVSHLGSFTSVAYAGNSYSASKLSNFAQISATSDISKARVVTYDQWVSLSGETGSQAQTASTPDPGRNLDTYVKTINPAWGLSDFFSAIRTHSKRNWHPEYMAAAIIGYIRQGFGLKPLH